jgi:hypothetical protein
MMTRCLIAVAVGASWLRRAPPAAVAGAVAPTAGAAELDKGFASAAASKPAETQIEAPRRDFRRSIAFHL